jgi:hypothetical protein
MSWCTQLVSWEGNKEVLRSKQEWQSTERIKIGEGNSQEENKGEVYAVVRLLWSWVWRWREVQEARHFLGSSTGSRSRSTWPLKQTHYLRWHESVPTTPVVGQKQPCLTSADWDRAFKVQSMNKWVWKNESLVSFPGTYFSHHTNNFWM